MPVPGGKVLMRTLPIPPPTVPFCLYESFEPFLYSGPAAGFRKTTIFWSKVKLSYSNRALLAALFVITTACQPAAVAPAKTATPFSIAIIELRRNELKWQNAGVLHYHFRL